RRGVKLWRIVARFRHENQLTIAHADFVARGQATGAGELAAVQKGAVLGGDVVQLAAVAGVHQDGAMTPGNVGVPENDIVLGRPAYGVKADSKWISVVAIDKPEAQANVVRRERVGAACVGAGHGLLARLWALGSA